MKTRKSVSAMETVRAARNQNETSHLHLCVNRAVSPQQHTHCTHSNIMWIVVIRVQWQSQWANLANTRAILVYTFPHRT